MVDVKKLLTKILQKLKITPVSLDSTKYECTQVGTTYEYSSINGMEDYSVIAVYFYVHDVSQLLYFVRPLPGDCNLIDTPSAGRFRGSIRVDWENEAIGIRCVSAGTAGTRYDLVYFKGVYGIA